MPSAAAPVPQSLRDALGARAAEDLSAWLDESIRQRAISRDEFREVLSRLDVVDERFEQMEARFDERFEQVEARFDERFEQVEARFDERFEQVDQRFEAVEGRLGRLEGEMGSLRGEVSTLRSEMNERFDAMGARFDGRLDAINEAMRRQTRWTVGAIVAIGAILSALLSIAEFAA